MESFFPPFFFLIAPWPLMYVSRFPRLSIQRGGQNQQQQQQQQVPQTRNDEEEAEGDGEVERLGSEIARLNTSSPNAQSLEGEGEEEERPNSITRPQCPV